jgi:predicted enzyme related to lactoylglutathione lyase
VNFNQPPENADWGTAAVFADPDGNQFVLGSG